MNREKYTGKLKTVTGGVANSNMPFGDLKVTVLVERDELGDALIRELQRLRFRVQHSWPIPNQLPVDNDVIFCALEQGLPQRIPWVPGVPEATLVLVDRGRVELDLKLVRNCASHGVLHLPATARHIHTTLLMAREHYEYECRLRGRIDKLDESLRGVRTVERAKSILISDRNLNEEAAYDFMRQRAMEKRVPIVAIATLIVDTHELLD